MEYQLYDEKGSCAICSTSTVQRRVDSGEYRLHTRRHIEAGDPVFEDNGGEFLVRSGDDAHDHHQTLAGGCCG